MNFLEFFTNKKDQNTIGKYECDADKLADVFIRLMDMVGLTNPGVVKVNGTKAVSISKNGDKYVLTLLAFNPPITIEWTKNMPISHLTNYLDTLSFGNKKVAYLNTHSFQGGDQFQLALA